MSKDLLQLTEEELKTKSQATYFFDCTNSWFNKPENERWKKDNNENIIEPKIPTVPFGSFCCVLQRLKYRKIEITEKGVNVEKLEEIDNPTNVIPFDENKSKETLPDYFILTAGHNLNSSTKDYKLIKDANNFVVLELITDYRTNGYDAAVLKINKITEDAKTVYDITDNNPDNNDIKKSTDFYGMAIKFLDNFAKNIKNEFPDLDEKTVSVDSITVGYTGDKIYSSKFYKSNTASDKLYYYKPQISGGDGISGGCVFKDSSSRLLGGIHKGIGNYGKIPCSTFTPVDIFITKDYKII